MRRRIELSAGPVRIAAVIDTQGSLLTREEVERVRDALADRLQEAAAALPFIGVPRNRVKVR